MVWLTIQVQTACRILAGDFRACKIEANGWNDAHILQDDIVVCEGLRGTTSAYNAKISIPRTKKEENF